MKISPFLVALFLASSVVSSSCNKLQKKDDKAETLALTKTDMKNVYYGRDTTQAMDIYLPAERDKSKTNIIVFIHGGSWSGGDKSEFNAAINFIREKLPAYAMFNINYRLARSGQNRYPTQMQDIQAAIDYITSKAVQYQVNANKIVLIGASAGAHLALLQAYKNNKDGRVKAVVDLFGPTDLNDLYNNHPVPAASQPVLLSLLGASPTTNAGLYYDVSPLNFVSTQSVPTKIFHGAMDYVVPVTQSYALKEKLTQNGVKADLTVYRNEGHGWYGHSLQDTFDKTVSFIKQNVH